MVKKLWKQEWRAFGRLLWPVNLAALALSVLFRLVMLLSDTSVGVQIIQGSAGVILVISLLVCLGATFVMSLVRFYKNLFTHEGYLSFTLPITKRAHIWVKLSVSVVYDLLAFVTCLLAGVAANAGENLHEIRLAAVFLWEKYYDKYGLNLVFWVIEFALLVLAAVVMYHLLTYACIALGQRAKKKKLFCAFAIFFVYYVAIQILMTLAIVVLVNIPQNLLEPIMDWIEENFLLFRHLLLTGGTVVMGLFAGLYHLITRKNLEKHLNLE